MVNDGATNQPRQLSGEFTQSVWASVIEYAEHYNDPGVFTAFIGYEWTSVPGGNNLHRNILYRDGKDTADQAFPFSAWQSEDPEKLWSEWSTTKRKRAAN